MLAKRIIPCLDVKDGRVVKGTNFQELKDAGDAVVLAKRYEEEGADELVFLDISASSEKRKTVKKLVERVANVLSIPFTVGGGIRTVEEIRELLEAGADKVSINTSAIENPELISSASKIFGSQCIVVAIDAKRRSGKNGKGEERKGMTGEWNVFSYGGRKETDLDAIKWAKDAEKRGAGEILLTSMDADGTKNGYDLELTKNVSESVSIPVIASGGAGKLEDLLDVFQEGKADAALVASIFHYGKYSIQDAKKFLKKNKIEVRI